MTHELRLTDQVTIPQIGFGTFQIPADDTQAAVERALELGYRHVDTAAAYNNEQGVGAALRASGRSDVFVTTKLRNADQGYDEALSAFERSREALGVEVIDLYLIHWPVPSQDRYVESWSALLKLRSDGVVRAIGVSNFLSEHLQRIERETGARPAINQTEIHPSFSQPRLRALCAELGIAVEAYSPLGQGADLEHRPGDRGRRQARRHARAGSAALASAVRPDRDPEVGQRRADARESRARRF